MNQTFQTIRVGIFFVLGVALIYAVYSVIGSTTFRKAEGYQLEARFDNIRTLATGADVRIAGVRIGEVSATELVDGRGRVVLKIDPAYEIPEDSVATIMMSSLLGQNYLAIRYGTSPQVLSAGAQLQSAESADFNEILGEVQQLGEKLNRIADNFGGFGGDGEMGNLVSNLNALVTDNRERIDTTMSNLQEITTKLNRSEGTLGKLINEDGLYNELSGVVGQLRGAADEMSEALGGARDLIAKVEAGEGTLGRLISSDEIALELEATVANLRAFSEKLASGEGTLGKLVTDDSFYRELRGLMGKADAALDNLGDSGPITALGAVSGALF
jgi:phospholipid/cholesterol/gamma-HCH transport system substrate-binding protein